MVRAHLGRRPAPLVATAILCTAAAVLACAAAYEAAVAVGWLPLGSLPGEGPVAEGPVFGAAQLALVVGTCTLVFAGRGAAGPAAAAVLAAAAFVVARFFAFDPYYAPTLRRSSEGGFVTGTWIVAVAFVAVATAALAVWRPSVGMRLGSAVLLLCALTAVAERLGH